MKKEKRKYFIIGGIVIIILLIIILLLYFNKSYDVELEVDNLTYYHANLKKGDTLRNVEPPTKEGYTFVGWYVDGEEFDLDTPIEHNIKLEAKFTKNKYVVIIDNNNGQENTVLDVLYGEVIDKPKDPSRSGYKFKGWYVGDDAYDFNTKIISNINITAKWEKIKSTEESVDKAKLGKYRVEHYLMDTLGEYPEVPNIVETKEGNVGTLVNVVAKTFSGFTSPNTEEITILKNEEVVVRYYYKRNTYTLKVEKDNGIREIIFKPEKDEYYYGETVEITALLNNGYEFNKWSTEENSLEISYKMGLNNNVIKALTNPIDYNITYELSGAEGTNLPEKYNVENKIILDEIVKPGYDFVSWSINGEEIEGNVIEPNTWYGDLEIEANFTPRNDTPYKIEYYLMGIDGEYPSQPSETIDNLEGTTDSVIDFTPEIKTGFKEGILKSTSDGEAITEDVTINGNGDTILKYYYEREQYNITFTKDNGIKDIEVKSKIEDGIYYYEEEVTMTAILNNGYEFDKWSTGETIVTISKNITENLNLTVTSKPIEYQITFDTTGVEGITCEECSLMTYTIEDSKKLPTPTKEGYTFNGWVKDGELITEIPKGTYGNIDLTLREDSFTPMNVTYNVLHLKSNKENNEIDNNINTVEECSTSDLCEVEELVAPYDSKVTPTDKNYDGFNAEIPQNIEVKKDLIIIVQYTRKDFELTIEVDEGINKLTINNETKNIENNQYTGLYYFEQPLNIEVEPKMGYHLKNSSSDKMEITMPASNKNISFASEGNTFTIKYHYKNDAEEIVEETSEQFVYSENSGIELKTIGDKTYTLTIKGIKALPIVQKPEISFVNEFGGWSKDSDNTALDYVKGQDASIIPAENNATIDLYAYYNKAKKDISELQTFGSTFYDGDRYYFNGYIDGENKIKKEEFKEYTIDENKTLTCWWLDVISLETFDNLLMENVDKTSFNSRVVSEDKVVGFINKAKSLSYNPWVITTLQFKFISPTIDLLAKDERLNKIILDINGQQTIIDGEALHENKALLGLFSPMVANADNKNIKVTVELNPELAISKKETSSIVYTLNIQAVVDQNDMDSFTEDASSILDIFNNNGKLKVDSSKASEKGEITFMYQNPNESLSMSPLLFSGWSTAIDKLFENPFVESIDVTFTKKLSAEYDKYLVTGQNNNTYKITYTNRHLFAYMLNSDTSSFGKIVSDLYKEGNDGERYKLKVKLNFSGGNIVDYAEGYSNNMKTEYTILFGPLNQ